MFGLIIGALGVLFGLAVLVGNAMDRQARDEAWKRIATSRRIYHLMARDLDEKTVALQVWETELDRRERVVDHREMVQMEREEHLERWERAMRGDTGPPAS